MIHFNWTDWPSRQLSPAFPAWGWGWNCCCDTSPAYHHFGGETSAAVVTTDNTRYVVDSWTTKTVMPVARHTAGAFHISAAYITSGGNSGGTLTSTYKYVGGSTDTWTSRTSITASRQEPAAFSFGLFAYVFGGQSGASDTNVNYKYDEAGDSWSTKATLPTNRGYHAGAATPNYGYSAAGQGDGTATYQYDTSGDTWATKTAMTTGRVGGAGLGLSGKIYVGPGLSIPSLVLTALVHGYNEGTNSWSSIGNTSVARKTTASGELDGAGTGYWTAGGDQTANIKNAHDEFTPNAFLTRTNATSVFLSRASRA